MNRILAAWNQAGEAAAIESAVTCCGARRWAHDLVALRPFESVESLRITADELWRAMEETDWLEAFACHPRIGERAPAELAEAGQSMTWSQQEQSSTATAAATILSELAKGNKLYRQRFGFNYIVCATGKSAAEMLDILRNRIDRDRSIELSEAAEQQRQIMQIRLRKWLAE